MNSVQSLEKEIRRNFKASRKCNAKLRNSIQKQGKNFDRERKCWDRDKKRSEHEVQKIYTHTLEIPS